MKKTMSATGRQSVIAKIILHIGLAILENTKC